MECPPMKVNISVLRHAETGLLAALCDEYPGFILHAHDNESLDAKLKPALEDYLAAVFNKPVRLKPLVQKTPPGYSPPSYSAEFAKAA
jgi:hypothetical protein